MFESLALPDPLSAALMQMGVHSMFSGAVDAGGDWALEVPGHTGFKLHCMLKGSAWVKMSRSGMRYFLRPGDCFLVTSGEPLLAASDLRLRKRTTMDEAIKSFRNGVITLNGGGDCQVITVHFQFEGHLPAVLFSSLAGVIAIDAAEEGADGLRWSIERLRMEFMDRKVGRAILLQHLAPIALVQALRVHLDRAPEKSGWLAALSDPRLSKAIEAIHLHYDQPWTLDGLARIAGLSRAGFAQNFKKMVGITPGDYLAQWRMQVASKLLKNRNDLSIASVAFEVGYESESAFSTAFRKIVGSRPGAYRSMQSQLPASSPEGSDRGSALETSK